ncbi:RsmF rRNA methyltransferase first C-terminal domain-containing protein [Enterocloster bolteae]|uniref:RsmF rRNA methyltransferase first C-terminal domain-containing protein n=1 Tax=Enterocloster bolteae TaxID=208479 RepID=UPI000E44E151|nr:RsmB/NOP family class I SAM-dependent RNA methyltransferase [Enterocloster bolteae]RGK76639.1 SAM-dependent methyltransferase [Enterocloster bolteae]
MTDVRQLPEAFLLKMQELLGEEFGQYLESFKEEWKPGLRVNTLKLSPGELAELVPWNLEPVPWADNGFYYDGTLDGEVLRPSKHPAYYAGLYYLQEPSAMTPAAMLPVVPGDRVLDLCAAPGGKSTELASKLKGRGMLVSNDISYSRARALLKNLELAGAANICVTSEAPEKLAGVWPEFFDKILVDAPCSGEGMFRRDEDMVKDWNEKGPEYYVPIQRQILSQAAAMLRPGGYMLYSTCTFSVEEDEGNVAYVLEEFPQMQLCCLDLDKVPGACGGFGLSGCMRLFPYRLKGEGHFLALMRKKGGDDGGKEILPPMDSGTARKRVRAVEKEKELDAFLRQSGAEWDYGRIVIHQDNVYYLPEGLAWNLPLRFLRTGLFLGELKKGRFEPSQALAMSMKAGQFPNTVSFPAGDSRVLRYLKGETISLEGDEGPVKGWCLAAMEGFPLGWAKGTGMSLKNKYYPGWRWQ